MNALISTLTSFRNLFIKIYTHREVIKSMVGQELKDRYINTIGGLVWALIHPFLVVFTYWFVFSVGFRVTVPGDVPFIVVFLCGFIPWMIFSESLSANTNILLTQSHLITKTVFPTEILPLIPLLLSLVSHFVLLLFFLMIMIISGINFSIYNFQFIYYLFALSIFLIGLSWLLSSINIFFRDLGQIVKAILPLWFWLTPIVWMKSMIPEKYHLFIDLNPLFYIVEGYRQSFIYHAPFWQDLRLGAYFWSCTLFIFLLGGLIFKKLKPEFPEVL
ncbi:ABC transporter permease [Nitrospina sp. 32_T5]|uniref:ABC transporter permease n=1 Tax=unclassified Nitrospina TaxID=2638683 RepID=UPI003F9C8EF4